MEKNGDVLKMHRGRALLLLGSCCKGLTLTGTPGPAQHRGGRPQGLGEAFSVLLFSFFFLFADKRMRDFSKVLGNKAPDYTSSCTRGFMLHSYLKISQHLHTYPLCLPISLQK